MTTQISQRQRDACRDQLKAILAEIPILEVEAEPDSDAESARPSRRNSGLTVDRFTLRSAGRTVHLAAVYTADGAPRSVRAAVQMGQTVLEPRVTVMAGGPAPGTPATPGRRVVLVLTPRLGPTGRTICQESGAGWCDLAGNLFLSAGTIYIDRQRPEQTKPEKRVLRHLFAPRAGRVLRVLVSDISRTWSLTDLTKESGVSLGLTHRIKERLLDQEVARMVGRKLQVHHPEPLLSRWPAAVAPPPDKIHDFYAPGTGATNEKALADFCRNNRLPYAFTREAAFQRRVGPIRYLLSQAWVLAPIGELAAALGWEPATKRANFRLMEPPDYGVLYGVQEINGDRVVSDLQLYLDFAEEGERGKAAADLLLEKALRPTWAVALSEGH